MGLLKNLGVVLLKILWVGLLKNIGVGLLKNSGCAITQKYRSGIVKRCRKTRGGISIYHQGRVAAFEWHSLAPNIHLLFNFNKGMLTLSSQ